MLKLNKFDSVFEQWVYNAENYPERDAMIHWVAGEVPFRWTFKTIMEQANRFSFLLREIGIKPGDVCAIIIKHNKYFYPLYMGIAGLGAIPAVLAYPNPRLHPEKFKSGLLGMTERSGLDWILTERSLEEIISPLVTRSESTIRGLYYPLEWDIDKELSVDDLQSLSDYRKKFKPEDPFLLQHSSGTTGLQKPVLLSNQAILKHVQYYCDSIEMTYDDKIASWLPLYHDMGLIAAFHLPLAFGIPVVQIDPFEWVLAPSLLFDAISNEKASVCWLPNFAYNFMVDRVDDEEMEGLRLDSVRLSINCSEPVRNDSHVKFYNRFKDYGFKETALSACYAMAETTYGVTQTKPGELISIKTVDREKLAAGTVAPAEDGKPFRVCVSSGKVIEGCGVKIVDDNRNEVADGLVGEIVISSVSMFDGYRNYPEKTAAVLIDNWYYSGDYGFMLEGECYVIGRKKDIIIVAGKNIYPEDVEDAVNKVDGVLAGRVISFGEENTDLGTEEISVIAETKLAAGEERKALYRRILDAGMAIDVTIANIYLVDSRWLIKSSAGKPSRSANRERIFQMKLKGEEIK